MVLSLQMTLGSHHLVETRLTRSSGLLWKTCLDCASLSCRQISIYTDLINSRDIRLPINLETSLRATSKSTSKFLLSRSAISSIVYPDLRSFQINKPVRFK